MILSLFHAQNNRIVDGDIQVIDTDRAKAITKAMNTFCFRIKKVNLPSSRCFLRHFDTKGSGACQLPVPLADTVKPFIDLMGTTIVIRFDLVRVEVEVLDR